MTRAGLIGALLLTGCVPAHPPAPPAAAVAPPAGWRTAIGPVAPLADGWWRAFGDPALNALVDLALAHNVDIAIAAARVQEARAQERLARAALYPTLDLGGGASYGQSVSPFGQPTRTLAAQPQFQAAYEIDLFGRIAAQVSAARAAYLASQAARDATALTVTAATASGYVTLRALDARLGILRQTRAARTEALRIARSRAEAGYTSQLELRQAEAEYESTAQAIPPAEAAIARQENALSLLVGAAPRAIVRGQPLGRLTAPPVPDGLPSDLLRRRPDLAQAELTLAASDASLAAARAQFLPQVRLTGSAGGVLADTLGDPIGLFSIGASVLAPLFAGGRLTAQVDTAASRRDQAAFAYRRAVLTAFREVDDALAGVGRLREQRAHLEGQRRATAEALRHASNRYQAGYSPYLDQLDAQRALLSAELLLVQTQADELTALIALSQAMGGGWSGLATTYP